MRQHVIAHVQSIVSISGGASHLQMLVDTLGSAMSAQEGRIAGLEQYTAQLQFYIEALRLGQEEQWDTQPPPASHYGGGGGARRTGGGFPVGGGLGLRGAFSGCDEPGGCSAAHAQHREGGDCHCKHVEQLLTDVAVLKSSAANSAGNDPRARSREPAGSAEPGNVGAEQNCITSTGYAHEANAPSVHRTSR